MIKIAEIPNLQSLMPTLVASGNNLPASSFVPLQRHPPVHIIHQVQIQPPMRMVQNPNPTIVATTIHNMQAERENLLRQLADHDGIKKQLQGQIYTLQAEKQRHGEDLAILKAQHDHHSKQHKHFEDLYKAASETVAQMQQERDNAIEELKKRKGEFQTLRSSNETEIVTLRRQLKSITTELESNINALETQLNKIVPNVQILEGKLSAANTQIHELRAELAAKAVDLAKCENDLDESRKTANLYEQKRNSAEARSQSTLEAQQNKHTLEMKKLQGQVSDHAKRLESTIPTETFVQMQKDYREMLRNERIIAAELYPRTKRGKLFGLPKLLNSEQRIMRENDIESAARLATRLQFMARYHKIDPDKTNITQTAAHFQNKYTNQEFNMKNERGLYCAHKM